MTNSELKSLAKKQLKGRWIKVVLFCLIYMAVILGPSVVINYNSDPMATNGNIQFTSNIIISILSGPIELGLGYICLRFIRNEEEVTDIFFGFKKFGKAFLAALLKGIITGIGYILLIVPGIIASLMFSQVYYILAENEDMSAVEAMKESARIMKGNKGRLFMLNLSFIGWFLLSVITLGVGFLWSIPYNTIALTNFYKEITSPEY